MRAFAKNVVKVVNFINLLLKVKRHVNTFIIRSSVKIKMLLSCIYLCIYVFIIEIRV